MFGRGGSRVGAVLLCTALIGAGGASLGQARESDGGTGEQVTSLIVRYAPGVRPAEAPGVATGAGTVGVDLQPGDYIGFGYRTVDLPEPVDIATAESIAADLADTSQVITAGVDTSVSISIDARSVQTSPPWGLDRIDQRARPLDARYEYGNSTGAGVRAYIVDTGIRPTHVDFNGRVITGYSSINDGRGTDDCNGHGTHVGGTVAGMNYGVAKGATLVPIRVLGCDGSGTMSTVIAGLDWIRVNHPSNTPGVVNMSLGGGASTDLDFAVRSVINAGLTVVVASGNSGLDACAFSPARVGPAITVNASRDNDTYAWFSNYGSCTDVYAPGVGVQSAYYTSDTSVASLSGTSMAAPHVAGVVARLLQSDPTMTPAAIDAAIKASATYIDFDPVFPTDAKLLLYAQPINATAPSVPSAVQAVPGNAQAAVTWAPPGSDGGAAVSGYTVTSSPGGFTCTTTGATTCTVAGLTNWTAYTFTVTATNSAGTSPASVPSDAVTPGRVPETPAGLSSQAGSGEAIITWTPGSDNGSSVTQFVASIAAGTRACVTTLTSCTITGLTQGTTYSVSVTARNLFGVSLPSSNTSVTVTSSATMVSPDPGTLVRWGSSEIVGEDFFTGLIALSAGSSHVLGLTSDRSVVAGGDNTNGQINLPSVAAGNARAVAAGGAHSLAIIDDSVVAWGSDSAQQSQAPASTSSGIIAIAAGDSHSLALRGSEVIAWGDNTSGQATPPGDNAGFSAIAAGARHSLALKAGVVIAWGSNASGQTAVPASAQSGVTAVAAGGNNSLALRDGGEVIAWGDASTGVTNVPAALSSGVTAIAVGDGHALAIKNGAVYAWGMNTQGQSIVPAEASADVQVIAAAAGNSFALRATPLAPTNVQAAATSETTITVSWAPVARSGTPVDFYRVSAQVVAGEISPASITTTSVDDSTTGVSLILPGVTPGAILRVTVSAHNLVGLGQSSQPISARIPVVPTQVRSLVATSGNGAVTVSWQPPADDGGSPVVGYYYRVDEGVWTLQSATTLSLTGLANGSAVTVGVRAANDLGQGTITSVTATPSAPPPPPPPAGGGGGGGAAPPPPPPSPPVAPPAPAPTPISGPVSPGSGVVIVDGEIIQVELGSNPSGTGVSIVGPDFALDMAAVDIDGRPLAVDERGALVLQPGSALTTRGNGFAPGSMVGLYLDPPAVSQLSTRSNEFFDLGEVTVDENGEFAGVVTLPAALAAGERVLQIVGSDSEGAVRMIAIGVQVDERAESPRAVILITGNRDGRLVRVSGAAENLVGQRLVPLMRLRGQTGFTIGQARPIVRADGTFTWKRITGKAITIVIRTQDGSVRSDRVVIGSR